MELMIRLTLHSLHWVIIYCSSKPIIIGIGRFVTVNEYFQFFIITTSWHHGPAINNGPHCSGIGCPPPPCKFYLEIYLTDHDDLELDNVSVFLSVLIRTYYLYFLLQLKFKLTNISITPKPIKIYKSAVSSGFIVNGWWWIILLLV